LFKPSRKIIILLSLNGRQKRDSKEAEVREPLISTVQPPRHALCSVHRIENPTPPSAENVPPLGKRPDYLSWDDYFMSVAFLSAMRSKDPSTQVSLIRTFGVLAS
jgi:deoxycytidylate deaminase